MVRRILISFFLSTVFCISYAQDIHFSQYYNTPLMINPSLTGEFNGSNRFILNYRDQWSILTDNSYKTLATSYDRSVYKDNLFSGIQIFNDKAGDSEMGLFQIALSIASKVKIYKNDFLKLGIQGSWSQYSYNFNKLTWNSQYDGKNFDPDLSSDEINNHESFSYVDFSTGLLWTHTLKNNNIFNLGLSAFHITQPSYSSFIADEELYIRWVLHGDLSYTLTNTNLVLYPSFLAMKQGPSTEINIGVVVKYFFGFKTEDKNNSEQSYLSLGAFYRNRDAIIINALYNYKSQFDISLSYDINISKLNNASKTMGGFEISLIYTIPGKKINKRNT